jgi:hypothetical protein
LNPENDSDLHSFASSPRQTRPAHAIMMENLSISDAPPPGGPAAQQPFAQLPPQMFTTAAQLLDLTDSMGFFP